MPLVYALILVELWLELGVRLGLGLGLGFELGLVPLVYALHTGKPRIDRDPPQPGVQCELALSLH